MKRTAKQDQPFSVIPPLGSKSRVTFHNTLEEARSEAFNVTASSIGDKTEIVKRESYGYETVGHYDDLGRFHQN